MRMWCVCVFTRLCECWSAYAYWCRKYIDFLNIYEMTAACGFLVLLMHTLCILSNIIVHQVEWYVSEVLRIRRVALKSCFGDFMYSLAMKLFLTIPICVKSISNCRLKE